MPVSRGGFHDVGAVRAQSQSLSQREKRQRRVTAICDQAGALSRYGRKRARKRRHDGGGVGGERRGLPAAGCGIATTRRERRGALAVASFKRALDFAIGRPALEHVALVVRVLAFSEPELDLGAAVFEVDF